LSGRVANILKKIKGNYPKGILPIIREHHGGKIENERLISRMDVTAALTWLDRMAWSGESIRLNELYPDRFVPTTVHGDGKLWHSSDKGFENRRKTLNQANICDGRV
jgi:hypothetical protein